MTWNRSDPAGLLTHRCLIVPTTRGPLDCLVERSFYVSRLGIGNGYEYHIYNVAPTRFDGCQIVD